MITLCIVHVLFRYLLNTVIVQYEMCTLLHNIALFSPRLEASWER